ncbi:MAG TPA: CsgG/HfaB family protein [Gemmatimonadaceae bacterium]|nr:CsgG/HfaB family protein [Gemmatimonadaceae bacterium]
MRIALAAAALVLVARPAAAQDRQDGAGAADSTRRPALVIETFAFAAPQPATHRPPPLMPRDPGWRRPMPTLPLPPLPIARTVAHADGAGAVVPRRPPLPAPPAATADGEGLELVGVAVADLLTERLLATGRVAIVDRAMFEAEVGRHAPSSGDSLSAVAAAARRLGVRYLVRGSVVEFGSDESRAGAGGGRGVPFLGGLFVKRRKTRVVLAARLVHVETGLVVATARGEGTSKKGGSVAGGGIGGGVGGVVGTSTDARSSAPGEAMGRAVDALAAELAARFDQGRQ